MTQQFKPTDLGNVIAWWNVEDGWLVYPGLCKLADSIDYFVAYDHTLTNEEKLSVLGSLTARMKGKYANPN